MATDILIIVATLVVLVGLPRVVWLIARRRGATDRRYVLSVAFACEFILFGLTLLIFPHRWSGVYFVVAGLGHLYVAQAVHRAHRQAKSAALAV